jgi:dihydroflavonol-4-reductase
MTILVTGANGFIGSHIVRSLLRRGYPVRVFVRNNADTRNLSWLNIEIVRGDLLKASSIMDAAAGCKAVIHAAGWINTHPYNSWRVWEVNFIGTTNVLTAAHKAGVEKVIYTASIFALGVSPDGQPANEGVTGNLNHLRFPYISARRAAEAKAAKMLDSGLPLVFVYPTYCLGPGLHDLSASPYRQILAFLRGWMPFYSSGGLNLADVRDVAEAHVLALEHGGIGQKYLIGGENVTYRDLLAGLAKAADVRRLALPVPNAAILASGWLMQWFSRKPLMDAATARLMRYRWYYDSNKAMNELGYTPRPLDDTLRDTVAWLRENHYIR